MFRILVLLFVFITDVLVAATFTNPIKKSDGSDPYIVSVRLWSALIQRITIQQVYSDGYYCMHLSWRFDSLPKRVLQI